MIQKILISDESTSAPWSKDNQADFGHVQDLNQKLGLIVVWLRMKWTVKDIANRVAVMQEVPISRKRSLKSSQTKQPWPAVPTAIGIDEAAIKIEKQETWNIWVWKQSWCNSSTLELQQTTLEWIVQALSSNG